MLGEDTSSCGLVLKTEILVGMMVRLSVYAIDAVDLLNKDTQQSIVGFRRLYEEI